MAEFPIYEQMAKEVAEKALDEFLYEGKTLREWVKIIAEQEPCEDCISRKDTIDWLKQVTVTDGITFETGFKQILHDIEQMPSVKQKPKADSDCISRADALSACDEFNGKGHVWSCIRGRISKLPSVNPKEPKQGHWIEEFNDIEGEVRFTCSCCGKYQLFGTDYCYHCGARMSEVSE